MSFGFGVGDFIACSKLIKSIIGGLNDASGSAAEVKSIMEVLLALDRANFLTEAVWEQIKSQPASSKSLSMAAPFWVEFQLQRARCMVSLKNFIALVKPYNDSFMGENGGLRRNSRKMTWLLKSRDIQNAESDLNGHLRNLNIYQGALCQIQSLNNATHGVQVLSMLTDLKSYMSVVSKSMQSNASMSMSLGHVWESQLDDAIILHDAIGRRVLLPMMLMGSKRNLEDILRIMYRGIHGEKKIDRKEYIIWDEQADSTVDEANWSIAVQPKKQLSLNMIFVAPPSIKVESCPRCHEVTHSHKLSHQRRRCHKCQLTFHVFDTERVISGDGVYDASSHPYENKQEHERHTKAEISNMSISGNKNRLLKRNDDSIFRLVQFIRQKLVRAPLETVLKIESRREYDIFELPPIHRAAADGDIKGLQELLVSNSADLDSRLNRQTWSTQKNWSFEDSTPLHIACWHGHLQAMHYLLDQGANIHATNRASQNTLLHAICGHFPDKMFYPVIMRGGEIHASINSDVLSSLHAACRQGLPGIVSYLLSHGMDITARDSDGLPPLAHAALSGSQPVFGLLIEYGASTDITPNGSQKSVLHCAAEGGSSELVKLLLQQRHDISAKTSEGETPLHTACRNGHVEVLDLLISHGASVQCFDNQGFNPLHTACFSGHLSITEYLLKLDKNALMEHTATHGEIALLTACRTGNHDIIKALLYAGSSSDVYDNDGNCALHLACHSGKVDTVSCVIGEDLSNLNHFNKAGQTPLHVACRLGAAAIIKLLLQAGASVTTPEQDENRRYPLHLCCRKKATLASAKLILEADPDALSRQTLFDMTPLHHACDYGHTEIVSFFVEKGATLSRGNLFQETPLHLACTNDNIALVEYLLTKTELSAAGRTIFGHTPLHLATYFGKNVKIIELLLRHGADVSATNIHGEVPLHCAVEKSFPITKALLEADPSTLDAVSNAGWTPLGTACCFGRQSTVTYLLAQGANVDAQNEQGNTPLIISVMYMKTEIALLLLERGANVHARNKDGETAFHKAAELGSLSIMKALIAHGADTKARADDDWNAIRYLTRCEIEDLRGVEELLEVFSRDVTIEDKEWWVSRKEELKDDKDIEEIIRILGPYFDKSCTKSKQVALTA